MTQTIETVRSEVTVAAKDWARVRHVMAGSRAIKEADRAKAGTYLPVPNPADKSEENTERYSQYIERAVFFNASKRTLDGLIGIALGKRPQLEVPAELEVLESDTDGAGGSIYNQAHRALEDALAAGRFGLLADFPRSTGEISRAEQQAGNIHPVISLYAPEAIINWRFNEKNELSLVVLHETVEEADGYGTTEVDQWRELTLEHEDFEGQYVQQLWRRQGDGGAPEPYGRPIVVTDGAGNPWEEITFQFGGGVDNNAEVDIPPMLDLVELNIAHYRNSADYFESAFFNGQPTVAMAGLNQAWVDDNFKDGSVYIGSRGVIPLPEGGSMSMVQAAPNTLSSEAMVKLEQQMIALGARLMMQGEVAKTAEQSRSETAAAHSVLSLACDNVSAAYEQALRWAAAFAGRDADDITFRINTDFVGLNLDSNVLNALVASWQAGAIPQSDLWTALRNLGVIDPEKTDEELEGEIDEEGAGLSLDAPPPPGVNDAGDQQDIV